MCAGWEGGGGGGSASMRITFGGASFAFMNNSHLRFLFACLYDLAPPLRTHDLDAHMPLFKGRMFTGGVRTHVAPKDAGKILDARLPPRLTSPVPERL